MDITGWDVKVNALFFGALFAVFVFGPALVVAFAKSRPGYKHDDSPRPLVQKVSLALCLGLVTSIVMVWRDALPIVTILGRGVAAWLVGSAVAALFFAAVVYCERWFRPTGAPIKLEVFTVSFGIYCGLMGLIIAHKAPT